METKVKKLSGQQGLIRNEETKDSATAEDMKRKRDLREISPAMVGFKSHPPHQSFYFLKDFLKISIYLKYLSITKE